MGNHREFTESIGSLLKKVTTSINELTEEKAREVLTEVKVRNNLFLGFMTI